MYIGKYTMLCSFLQVTVSYSSRHYKINITFNQSQSYSRDIRSTVSHSSRL